MEKADISVRKKGKAADVLLVKEAMSSGESSVTEDESGKKKIVGYNVKRLSWESSKLICVKLILHKTMTESHILKGHASELSHEQTAKRKIGK